MFLVQTPRLFLALAFRVDVNVGPPDLRANEVAQLINVITEKIDSLKCSRCIVTVLALEYIWHTRHLVEVRNRPMRLPERVWVFLYPWLP